MQVLCCWFGFVVFFGCCVFVLFLFFCFCVCVGFVCLCFELAAVQKLSRLGVPWLSCNSCHVVQPSRGSCAAVGASIKRQISSTMACGQCAPCLSLCMQQALVAVALM